MRSVAYRVDLTERAARNLRRIYRIINAEDSARACEWFNGLQKAVFSPDENLARAPVIPEDAALALWAKAKRLPVYLRH